MVLRAVLARAAGEGGLSEVVRLPTTDERATAAFSAYCEAALLAQRTLDRADAVKAGRAWAAFLDLFAPAPSGTTAPTVAAPRLRTVQVSP